MENAVNETTLEKKDFSVNKTNLHIIKASGVKNPKELIGKKVWFKSVMNYRFFTSFVNYFLCKHNKYI